MTKKLKTAIDLIGGMGACQPALDFLRSQKTVKGALANAMKLPYRQGVNWLEWLAYDIGVLDKAHQRSMSAANRAWKRVHDRTGDYDKANKAADAIRDRAHYKCVMRWLVEKGLLPKPASAAGQR